MELNDLVAHSGDWLRGEGSDPDIVISSRIRLARNLADFPFISRASDTDRVRIESILRERTFEVESSENLCFVSLEAIPDLDRQFLVERHLISRELSESSGTRAVVVGKGQTYSIMINEEDHLRIQVMQSGLDLEAAWKKIDHIDNLIEQKVTYAYSDQYGYLTACPTNVGTGMRVSVMLHLPALVLSRQIEKVFRSLQKINLAVRGLYGEGSQALGDFYQISNQATLGMSETDLVNQVVDIVPRIISYERQARDFLLEESRQSLHDRIARALGILRTAQTISSEETMHLLSSVRMGVSLGLIEGVDIPQLNRLYIQIQPAHLQKMAGVELDSTDRDIERARYLRRHLLPDGEEGTEE